MKGKDTKLQHRRHRAVRHSALGLAIVAWARQENRAEGGKFTSQLPAVSWGRQLARSSAKPETPATKGSPTQRLPAEEQRDLITVRLLSCAASGWTPFYCIFVLFTLTFLPPFTQQGGSKLGNWRWVHPLYSLCGAAAEGFSESGGNSCSAWKNRAQAGERAPRAALETDPPELMAKTEGFCSL